MCFEAELLNALEVTAGCRCEALATVKQGTTVQALDVGIEDGGPQCMMEITAGTEVLIVSAYIVQGTIETDETTLPRM